MKKHANIPVFIPHLGCPHACVFCNQRSISGQTEFRFDDVAEKIDRALSTMPAGSGPQIAFFGGSFTGIDRNLMTDLLELAASYCRSGKASSIRLSTRPDFIDGGIIEILKKYPVRTVELGIQSLSDDVLIASKRGHTSEDSLRACRTVKDGGFELVGQMMIGLPCSDEAKEIATAKGICGAGADAARIYPTVVFYGTELCELAISGNYLPLDTREAVARTKSALSVFIAAGVPCIRVGLQSCENLSDAAKVYGGASHSAVGELAMGEIYFDLLSKLSENGRAGDNLTVYCAVGEVSKVVGQNKRNINRIREKYGFKKIKVVEKKEILSYNIVLEYF